jgi:hypothetical protein
MRSVWGNETLKAIMDVVEKRIYALRKANR